MTRRWWARPGSGVVCERSKELLPQRQAQEEFLVEEGTDVGRATTNGVSHACPSERLKVTPLAGDSCRQDPSSSSRPAVSSSGSTRRAENLSRHPPVWRAKVRLRGPRLRPGASPCQGKPLRERPQASFTPHWPGLVTWPPLHQSLFTCGAGALKPTPHWRGG